MSDKQTLEGKIRSLILTTPEERARMPPTKVAAIGVLEELWMGALEIEKMGSPEGGRNKRRRVTLSPGPGHQPPRGGDAGV